MDAWRAHRGNLWRQSRIRSDYSPRLSTRMSRLPIADYALLSDCHSAALVSRAGSVDWLCFPRFDAPSIFARLLDDGGGHWSVTVPAATATRRYADQTMVLET